MNISKNLKYFFILPGVLSLAAIIALGVWGLKPGIDLSGGSLLQVTYSAGRPPVGQIDALAAPLKLGEVRVQPTNTNSYIIRTRALSNDEHVNFSAALSGLGSMQEDEFTTVGPVIGQELLQKAWIAIALVVLCTIAFIAFAFRGVSKPVQSWKYGIVAIITLLHDILVPAGLFALLGHFVGAEVDALFIVALLTILGISINDTIVVFDRIRENLRRNEDHGKREEFAEVVGRSITQTITRSINTSLTVVIVLVALYFLGPEVTKNFALTLIVGMIAGTYSSIFLASPLLVVWQKWSQKKG
jgi:preprotein translocase subunit SecF